MESTRTPGAVPADLEVKLLLRILAFDRALATRSPGDTVRIAVVGGSTEAARHETAEVVAAFAAFAGKTISGRPFVHERLGGCPEVGFAVLYLGRDLGREELARCLERCAKTRTLAYAADPGYLGRGAAVAVRLMDGRPEILVQREHAVAQGADLDPRLLLYSTLVHDHPGDSDGKR
jgi:hypothetical protein